MKTVNIRRMVTHFVACLLIMSPVAFAKEKIIVAHDQWVGYSGFFVANAKGFFEEVDINVETVGFSGPGDTIPPLLAGHVDISLTTLYNLTLAAGQGEDSLKAIYLLDTSDGADAIVASAEMSSVSELKGKKIAVTTGEVNHLLLIAALKQANISESDVEIVNMSADDAGAAFLAGRVDAAVTWEPWVSRATSAGGKAIFTSADTPDLILDSIVVTDETLKNRRSALVRFIKAVDKGVAYMRSNPEESHEIIGKALTVSAQDAKEMLMGDKIYDLKDNMKLLAPNGQGVKAVAEVMEFLDGQGLIKSAIDVDNLFNVELISE